MISLFRTILKNNERRHRGTLAHARNLSMESVESRVLLDGGGVLSSHDRYFTLSFASDETDIGGIESSLHATLDEKFNENDWHATILSAFDAWATHTATDVGVVEESGTHAFG
ncbi:MAG: hypothetical protein KDB27_18635, partial [Planctomycetales bacterium]|nr:hypothetical protein [Planctomycetales bacterium]